jgi:hypothetical protein
MLKNKRPTSIAPSFHLPVGRGEKRALSTQVYHCANLTIFILDMRTKTSGDFNGLKPHSKKTQPRALNAK